MVQNCTGQRHAASFVYMNKSWQIRLPLTSINGCYIVVRWPFLSFSEQYFLCSPFVYYHCFSPLAPQSTVNSIVYSTSSFARFSRVRTPTQDLSVWWLFSGLFVDNRELKNHDDDFADDDRKWVRVSCASATSKFCRRGVVDDAKQSRITSSCTRGGTLGISGWGCAAGTLEPLTYTRASSAEFCYPILE